MPVKRRVGRPRKRVARKRVVRRRQTGGQFGLLAGLLGPLIVKEVLGKAIPALGKVVGSAFKRKRKRGRGLRLAGQGHTRPRRRRVILL